MNMRGLFESIAASPSANLFAATAAFLAGIAAHAFVETPLLPGAAFILTVAMFASAFFLRGRRRLVLLCIAMFAAAFCRYDSVIRPIVTVSDVALSGETRFVGTVAEVPEQGIRSTIIVMSEVVAGGRSSPWRMRVVRRGGADVGAGDRAAWRCVPQKIPPAERLRSADGIFAHPIGWRCIVRDPPVVIARASSYAPIAPLSFLKNAVRDLVGRLLPEPEASLLLGLLIGDRRGLPDEIIGAFRDAGAAHVLAVSGYNVTRVIAAAALVFALGSVSRRTVAVAATIVVALFVALVGGSASAVRAAAMGCTALLAAFLGRRYAPTSSLALAAAVMLSANPLLLRYDVGFQLSFAAVWGMMTLAPPLALRLRAVPDALGLRSAAAETFAATVATLPVALMTFGRLPLAAVPVNAAVVPLVPWAMVFGAATLALGAIHPGLGLLPAGATSVILSVMIGVVTAGARILPPVDARAGPLAAVILAVGIIFIALVLARPRRNERLRL